MKTMMKILVVIVIIALLCVFFNRTGKIAKAREQSLKEIAKIRQGNIALGYYITEEGNKYVTAVSALEKHEYKEGSPAYKLLQESIEKAQENINCYSKRERENNERIQQIKNEFKKKHGREL